MSTHVPPPHPVRKRPMVAIPLAVAAVGMVAVACNPPAAADATGPDCTLDVQVTWDGGTVAWITATTVPGDTAPRFTFQVLGEGNASLYYSQVTGEATATVYPAVDGATAVYVGEGWRPGPLCERWVYPPEPEPEAVEVEPPAPPAYAPVTPEPGDHRTDTTTPADPAPAEVSRVLHSR